MLDNGVSPETAVLGTTGCEEQWASKFRAELSGETEVRSSVAASLAGVGGRDAAGLRKKLLGDGASPISVLLGTIGVSDSGADDLREEMLFKAQQQGQPSDADDHLLHIAVARSLSALDYRLAERLRVQLGQLEREQIIERFLGKPEVAARSLVLESLAGLNSSAAWKVRYEGERDLERRRRLSPEETFGLGKSLARSLVGIDSPESYGFRERLMRLDVDLYELACSVSGLDSNGAQQLRSRIYALGEVSGVLRSLAGLFGPNFHELRMRLIGTEQGRYSEIDLACCMCSPEAVVKKIAY